MLKNKTCCNIFFAKHCACVLNKPFIVKCEMTQKTFSNLEALAVRYIGKKRGGMCHFFSFPQSETFQKGICNACHIFSYTSYWPDKSRGPWENRCHCIQTTLITLGFLQPQCLHVTVDYDCLCGLSWVHAAHSDGATRLCVSCYRTIRWKNQQQAPRQENALVRYLYTFEIHFVKSCIHICY